MKLINKLLHFLRKRENRSFVLGFLTIFILAAVFLYYQKSKSRVLIENSQVSAPIISLSSPTAGKLNEITVTEGKTVKKGDTLAIVGANTIHSDIDGLVIFTNKSVGGDVNPQSFIVQLVNPSDMRVDGTIDENKGLNLLKVGQVASFTVDALPGKTYWGYLDEIAPTAKQTQIAFSISSERPTQQFEIFVRFDARSYPDIKNGMSAKITVYTQTP